MSDKKLYLSKLPFIQKLKSIKHLEIYVAVIFVLILVAIYFTGNTKQVSTNTNSSVTSSVFDYATYLEEKLSKLLSDVDGAGKVSVMVTLDGTSEIVYATSIEEKTNESLITNGSTSNTIITTEPIFASGEPVVVKEYLPKITGVVVVSQGAESVKVKLELLRAVQTILDVSSSKIQILVGNK